MLCRCCACFTHTNAHTQTHTPNALCMCVYPGALRHCSRSEQQSLCVFPMRAACALTAVNTLADPAPITNRCHGSQMPCSCTVPPNLFPSVSLSLFQRLCVLNLRFSLTDSRFSLHSLADLLVRFKSRVLGGRKRRTTVTSIC